MTTDKEELKRQMAVALGYEADTNKAPIVKARGKGLLAEKIIEIAKEKGIPIKQDEDLIQLLYKLEVNEEIPPELYHAVAELLAFLYKVNEAKKKK